MAYKLVSPFSPQGDQPRAIDALCRGIEEGRRDQVLLGVTGSGKTFTMACVIAQTGRPALIIAPNKILAAQLYGEFRELFPENAVEYFISYYDYYQPEAYVPSRDLYIEKDSSINEDIDKLRHRATRALFEQQECIIVASVSCIYGLGSPEAYQGMLLYLEEGRAVTRDEILRKLVEIQYERNDFDFHRGTFRVRGDVIEVFPVHEDDTAIRIELFGDDLEALWQIDTIRNRKIARLGHVPIYPASHYVTPRSTLLAAVEAIRDEMSDRVAFYQAHNRLIEAQRIEERTRYDLEMLVETGVCKGIENYSRHLTGRMPGEPPPTLMDYLPRDTIVFLDESHVGVPQLIGMYRGDHSRKSTLVEYGFRLPSALDNRPLRFDEFNRLVNTIVYVSATPGDYELRQTKGQVVEQVVRPTGLLDPAIEIRPATGQVDDLYREIVRTVKQGGRVLVTTLTKRMAEELTDYYQGLDIKVKYMHSDIDTLERIELVKGLREGTFDVLVGINLLREGLDIPEVTLVAVMDADKEGFLRSERSLIQTAGRAARNIGGRVVMYADTRTGSIEKAYSETMRRRVKQEAYNKANGITPRSIQKNIRDILASIYERDYPDISAQIKTSMGTIELGRVKETMKELEKKMTAAAKDLRFEEAAGFRDEIKRLKRIHLAVEG
ncbi:MAG TPA: excinuclease ABC subunit UvrB [Deltaproteobacteria bacterium]|nr:excinuclease ABC subunit UvrB [Deltaproteobacteria bacterium]OQC29230.1 MAG: UvrABC system protein B [Deltaproteobacteria bacterium ADurb.Bin072]HRW80494.1 excinuclease ABC subunit UvrB [Desulfomonilia bacterium]NMD39913.1 excinuclease ABC subunit UvrB [Deltaproteobacteria bacterium]HNQ86128.1 excinuclease ABC subunit UvrB [Deltaproteobacteria bacterium]